jgi:hypothetical protein
MAPYQTASPALVGERLGAILKCFPAAAIGGVQWVTLVSKYEEKHCIKLDVQALGYDSALTAASALLWDVARIADAEDTDNPVLMIEDAVALTPQPASLANWPSLYEALTNIVRNEGTLDTACDANNSSSTYTILLSQVKPKLQRHWHKNFDDCGLTYYTEEGSIMKLKKLKHLLNAVFRWRADRLALRSSTKASTSVLSAVDAAIAVDLDIVPSTSHNDLLLRIFTSQAVPEAVSTTISADRNEVTEESQGPSVISDSEDDTLESASNYSMESELARLRAENAKLRSENTAVAAAKMLQIPNLLESSLWMDDVFDDPSEPPPAMWFSSSASTCPGSSTGSGSATPCTDASFSGSCTPVRVENINNGVTFMPVWFPVALGDRVQIPNGIVQQARAVFENQTTIPSFFSQ